MPEISRFFGLIIYLYFDEGSHHLPHFHVRYNEFEASIAIENFSKLTGWLPARALSLVIEWAAIHQAELLENWELVRNGDAPKKIKGLE